MRAWLSQHRQSLAQTIRRLRQSPLGVLANTAVIGVVLALPLGAYGLLANLQAMSGSLPTEPQISVFLTATADSSIASGLEARLRRAEGVRSVRFIPRDSALAGLKSAPGMSEVIVALRDNPLPDAFVVTLAASDPELAERLKATFKGMPGVAHVQVDSDWVRRVDGLLRLGRAVVGLLAALLGFALVAVTFNTIRLQALTHRDEIEVSRLVGATDTFIRRPFFYLGGLLGLLGSWVGLGIVLGGFTVINHFLLPLGQVYGIEPRLVFFAWPDVAAISTFSIVLGWVGSYISVSIHLRAPEAG